MTGGDVDYEPRIAEHPVNCFAILADDTEADRAEALAVALADPEAALLSFRTLKEANGGSPPWQNIRA